MMASTSTESKLQLNFPQLAPPSTATSMPLSSASSKEAHALQNGALLLLSFVFLPLDTLILFCSLLYSLVVSANAERSRRAARKARDFVPRTVLVTGVGMSKGLVIARIFYAAGHDVVGADFESVLMPVTCGRTSIALRKFYKLQKPLGSGAALPYAKSLVDIVVKEKVDIWISCSGVASALEDGTAKEMIESLTPCRAIQFDTATTQKLHEKHLFMDYTKSLGLTIPDTYTVTSKAAVLSLLENEKRGNKRYILKYIGTDDTVRGDMTLLPFSTPAATKAHINKLQISAERPWILQQFIQGPEYCTHAVVVKGEVRAFVACPSAELLMHYEALPEKSALSQSMLRFTQEFAAAGGESFSGHLSFDFLVDAADAEAARQDPSVDVKLWPIECNPRAHTAVVLFGNSPDYAEAYLPLLAKQVKKPAKLTNGNSAQPVYPTRPAKFYWIGHDLVEKVILPLYRSFSNKSTSSTSITAFLNLVLFWKDGTFEIWDPWPAWWLYHVYWPAQFAAALVLGRRWSRINVSTTKMFMC